MSASYPVNDDAARKAAPIGALRRFTRNRQPARMPMEHCELCGEVIAANHRHLLELSGRALVCACQACSILFSERGGKYHLIPRRYLMLPDFHMTDEQWDELMIPVGMVYLFYNTLAGQIMAFYPGPAGATESLLRQERWETLLGDNPVLSDLEPDVETLLINRVRGAREYYIAPIDACYQLVGLIRSTWRGLSGGEEARMAIEGFFADLRTKAQPMRGVADAGSEL